jgi:hypothetical protein
MRELTKHLGMSFRMTAESKFQVPAGTGDEPPGQVDTFKRQGDGNEENSFYSVDVFWIGLVFGLRPYDAHMARSGKKCREQNDYNPGEDR